MPNVIKYSPGSTPSGTLKKGDMAIGNNTVDYGSTFYSGITPPSGGYTIYLNKVSNGPSIICPVNDTELIYWTKAISGNTYATAAECLNWFAGQNDKVVVNKDYEGVVMDGLVLNIDASFVPSYPTTGTTWYDIGPNSLNATLTNGPVFQSGSIYFDGTDDQGSIVGTSSVLDITSQITMIAWVNPTTIAATWQGIFLRQTVGDYELWMYGNKLRYGIRLNGSMYRQDGSISLSTNTWYMLAWTYDGSAVRLYVNGVADSSFARTGTINTSDGIIYIGYSGFASERFNGKIARCQLYNRALSAYEISKNYIAGLGTNIVTDGLRLITSWSSLAALTSRTANSVVAPDGSMTATLFERVSVANAGHAQIRQQLPTIDLEPNTSYRVSFWAKRIYLTQTIVFDFSDTPSQTITLTDNWVFYNYILTTGSSFPVGEFIDIGSNTTAGGSQLGERYSIWSLHVSLA